jgi:hypothetical protein
LSSLFWLQVQSALSSVFLQFFCNNKICSLMHSIRILRPTL